MKILIVDDNADIRLMLHMQLRYLDGVDELIEAVNGVEAVERASRHQPDLIVLDLEMPIMSGDAALPLLRTLVPGALIAVNSATRVAQPPSNGLELADVFLEKLRDDVGEFVQSVLARRHQGRVEAS